MSILLSLKIIIDLHLKDLFFFKVNLTSLSVCQVARAT